MKNSKKIPSILILFSGIFLFAFSFSDAQLIPVDAQEYRQAPDYKAITLDGNPASVSDYRGKVILVNVWATWCLRCRDEMPSLDKLQSLKSFDNLKVFPINVGKEKKEKAEKFFQEYKIENLDLYIDDSVNLANKFKLRGLPTTVIINKEGEEFARIVGGIDFSDKKFIQWLKQFN